jgi:pimeloyl-ACP methyl ester carboxylesterase
MIEPLQLPARGLVFDALAAGPPAGDLVADVVAIADRLGAETFHLVGHDWGGVVAWRLAGRHPERVATLTAVSTPHPRAFARALVAGTQALRSAYIPVFRLPRLPELLLGAHRQWGLRRLLAPRVGVPTLYVWGSGDPALGPRAAITTGRWVTGAYRFEVLPGAGHWLPEHHAEQLGRLLLEHLRRWDARPSAAGGRAG